MRCLYCGKRLSLLHKLSGREFCGDEHYALYMQDQESLGLARLIEAKQHSARPAGQRKKSSRTSPVPENLPPLATQFHVLAPEPQDDLRLAHAPPAPIRESMLVALPRIEVNLAVPGIVHCAPKPLAASIGGPALSACSGRPELAFVPVSEVLPHWSPVAALEPGLICAGPSCAVISPAAVPFVRPPIPSATVVSTAPIVEESPWPPVPPACGPAFPAAKSQRVDVVRPIGECVPPKPPGPPSPFAFGVLEIALPVESVAPVTTLTEISRCDPEKVHARPVAIDVAPRDVEWAFRSVTPAGHETSRRPAWIAYPETEGRERLVLKVAGFSDDFPGSLTHTAPPSQGAPKALSWTADPAMPGMAVSQRTPALARPDLLALEADACPAAPDRRCVAAGALPSRLFPCPPAPRGIEALPGLTTAGFVREEETEPAPVRPPAIAVRPVLPEPAGDVTPGDFPALNPAVAGLPLAAETATVAPVAPAAARTFSAAPEALPMTASVQPFGPRFESPELRPATDLLTAVGGFGCRSRDLLPLSLDSMAPVEGSTIHPASLEMLGQPLPPVIPRAFLDPVRESFASALPSRQPPVPVWKRLSAPINQAWHRVPAAGRWGLIIAPLVVILATQLLDRTPAVSASTTSPSDGMTSALAQRWEVLQTNIMNRAAISLTEDFRSGLAAWDGDGNWAKSWSYDNAGFIRPGDLALYRPSIPLADYHFEFAAQAECLSWVFRASDANNYHAARLVITDPGPIPKVALVRYAVIDGKKGKAESKEIPVALRNEKMYRIRVDVRGSSFTTYIDDQVVDFFRDERLGSGGVGFFRHGREAPRLRWVGVTHQYDVLGRLCALIAPYNMDNPPRSWNQ